MILMGDAFPFSHAMKAIGVTYHEVAAGVETESGDPIVVLQIDDANGRTVYYSLRVTQARALGVGLLKTTGDM